jgi:hypothetical protein
MTAQSIAQTAAGYMASAARYQWMSRDGWTCLLLQLDLPSLSRRQPFVKSSVAHKSR